MGTTSYNSIKTGWVILVAFGISLLSTLTVPATAAQVAMNSVSGSASLTRNDLVLGKIFPIAITRSYNSKSGYASSLGYGWAFSHDKQLFTTADGSVIIRTGVGQKKKYTYSGSTFTSPAGDFGKLTYNSTANTYSYTSLEGTVELYDQYGRLSSITDSRGCSLAFTYASTSKTPLKGLLPTNVDQTAATVIANVYQLTKIEEKQANGTATGKWVTFNYDPVTGLLDSISDSRERIVRYGHTDGIGNLTTVTGPGIISTYGYTEPSNKHLLTSVDEGNGVYTNIYDNVGRIWKQTYGNTTKEIAYTIPGTKSTVTTTVKDASGTVVSTESRIVTLDAQRQVINETDTTGNELRYTRNSQTLITRKEWWKNTGTVASPNLVHDHAVEYTYDGKGNILTNIEMDGRIGATPSNVPPSTYTYATTYVNGYDAAGYLKKVTETNPLSQITTYTYENNQIKTVSGPQGDFSITYNSDGKLHTVSNTLTTPVTEPFGTTTYDYENGNLTTITDARGKITTIHYDANDQIDYIIDPTTRRTDYHFDTSGNLRTITEGGSKTTTLDYDALNRLLTVTDPLRLVTTYSYDSNGNRSAVTDANGNAFRYTYNDQGQVATVTDALDNITTYSYGGSGCPSCGGSGGGNLVGLTDAKGQTTGWQYDFMNRIKQETDPLLKTAGYHYNSKGNVDNKTDANGNIILYEYDALKRLTSMTYPDNSTVAYSYKSNGRIETATNSNIAYTYGYDDAGRTTTVSDSRGYAINYEYDTIGNRTKITIQTGTTVDRVFTYTYDDAGRPATITSSAGTFAYHYDTFGRRDYIQYPLGIKAAYMYDDLHRLTGVTNTWGTEMIASVAYTDFDNVGNIKNRAVTFRDTSQPGVVNATMTDQYLYDTNYRLLGVTSNKPEAFSYDAVGNRLTGPGNKDTAYLYNAGNQMTHGRKLSYDYDNNGNQTTRTVADGVDKSWVLTWDYENQLVKMVKVKGTENKTITFKYDPHGRRIEKKTVTTLDGTPATTKSFTWTYVYDGDNIVVATTDETYYPDKIYYTHGSGVDEHLAMDRYNGVYYYYLNDGLGSVLNIIDFGGYVAQSFEYDSFGMTKPASSWLPSLYGYTGREWDKETGLYYYRARYYDPMEGRFISKDPLGIWSNMYNNQYMYVENNPINKIDPTGLWSVGLEGYAGIGGGLTIGKNPNGGWFYTARVGAGEGGGFQYDPDSQGPSYDKCNKGKQNVSLGLYLDAGVAVGPASLGYGMGAGAHLQSSPDAIRDYSYNGPKDVLDKGIRLRGSFSIGLELSGWNGGK